MTTPTIDPAHLRAYHTLSVQRNVERDLRRRFRRSLAKMPEAEQRVYLELESLAYALAFVAVAYPELAV